ncbi:mandelate racemase/muconate lactonizing enzyme family protein [Plantibacter sp. MCCC 1A11337]|uniref:mandelate racemase/muconate lactonizing enzyme family protein n=1 Tax=Plantibacter sp. MCCC 1A11337 TaxID=2736644 RepID=UPI00158446BC|nr:mandelate racemase/muconate lactonizing enzyme family protein [Plantibacter sp. MCCC 1A11337]NUJ86763.1 mandelate racemase/muconate lactonizing enzyme family protein [Plantibacter sp. MCCC 1A11337]
MRIERLDTYLQRVGERPRVLVRITTDDGVEGWSEVYNHGPDLAFPPLLEYLFEQIRGVDARRTSYVNQFLLQSSRFPPGAMGLAAIAAIDHALWDIAGKAAGLPVYQLLGGAVRDRVRVYAGLYAAPDVPQLVDTTAELSERNGYTAFKLSPYRAELHRNRFGLVAAELGRYFGEVRETLPDAWEFGFDAHACLWEPHQAVALAAALEPNEPLFLEEPIRPEYFPAWARIRSEMRVPLATGESLYSPNEFLSLLSVQGADIVQPDICVVGGLTQMVKIAHLAEAHLVPVAPHNPLGPLATAANVHFAAATTNFSILEFKPDPVSWCHDPYEPVDGHLELRPERPGWGIEIDLAALANDDWVHWQRRVPVKPDGSTAWM